MLNLLKIIRVTTFKKKLGEKMMSIKKNLQTATFGGGCFWCMVQPFENTEGVTQVISGYAGGTGG